MDKKLWRPTKYDLEKSILICEDNEDRAQFLLLILQNQCPEIRYKKLSWIKKSNKFWAGKLGFSVKKMDDIISYLCCKKFIMHEKILINKMSYSLFRVNAKLAYVLFGLCIRKKDKVFFGYSKEWIVERIYHIDVKQSEIAFDFMSIGWEIAMQNKELLNE